MGPTTTLSKPSATVLSILAAVVLSAGICSCDNMATYDVTMRDGTELASDVYSKPGAGATPTPWR